MDTAIRLVTALLVALLGTAMPAIGQVITAPPSLQPAGWDAEFKLPEAADLNADPHILEIDLEARVASVEYAAGHRIDAWTYNGGIPGPLIRLHVGDRLIVHFSNQLPAPTTVHWHGLRVPVQMDGVPGYSQPDVEPGQSFTYDFIVRDAGLYWYHPHVMSATQVGFGLYGALLVEDPAERVGVADELVLVLSDIAIDDDGGFEPPDSGGSGGMAFGREGNHPLVNGRTRPRLVARSGAPQRWRIVNTAKSRYFQLYMDGEQVTQIGGDGGLQEYPVKIEHLVLAPGERADVIVAPSTAPGQELVVRWVPFNRGYGSVELRTDEDLMVIAMAELPPLSGTPLPDIRRAIAPLSTVGATMVDLELTIVQLPDKSFEYGVNGVPFWKAKSLLAKPGETQIWTLTNTTPWSHPFHLHGFFFQVLDEQGAPLRPMAWKDTVNVPFKQTRKFIVRFDDREGTWMFHCHILDHAEGGLMGTVQVGAASGTDHRHHDK